MTQYLPIRIVSPAAFEPGTAQTPGSVRLAAVAPQLGIQSTLWGGLFEVGPGARTGIHHHGEQQTVAYVLSGICDVRWGARGECTARAKTGDFIHIPAFLPHMEINPSDSETFHWVVVRSTPTPCARRPERAGRMAGAYQGQCAAAAPVWSGRFAGSVRARDASAQQRRGPIFWFSRRLRRRQYI
jgi:uncharacterized RmlC-like cupin family protein